MWTVEQRNRIVIEHEVLHREGFDQFSVYQDRSADTYWALGTASTNSGHQYRLYSPLPSGYPYQRPPLYVIEPCPLRMFDGSLVTAQGVSHQMHTLTPHSNGWVQICHWRDARWHSGILLQKVFLKALIWLEAYEQHLSTGRPLAEFVRTMAEIA